MLRLKEEPNEWIKFTGVMALVVNVVLWTLWYKGKLPIEAPQVAVAVAAITLLTAIYQPRWFRGIYRAGMTVSFQIGQVIGKILLTLMFFLVVTPMGLLLRLSGKDLLQIRNTSNEDEWWHKSKNSREFDRMF